MSKQPIRAYSGIQPSGAPHLGNDLGAIRNYVALQENYESIYCIVDYHALTSVHDGDRLRRQTREMAAALIACGIDTDRSILFNQAQVPQHAELQWLLNGTARMGWLNRMTQFCKGCVYDPKKRVGDDACPFTTLYWDFLDRHAETFGKNHRMSQQIFGLKRLTDLPELRMRAKEVLAGLDRGEI